MHITVHSPYLGTKKPLGGFYHYINIGSFFLMFFDKYGIKLYIRDEFPINLCGVDDNVETYQAYLISCFPDHTHLLFLVFKSY